MKSVLHLCLATLRPSALLLLLVWAAIVASSACGGEEDIPQPEPTASFSEDVSAYRERLGADLWRELDGVVWLNGDRATPEGARLLEVVAATGPLVTPERRLTIVRAYPEGLDAETLAFATQYARMAVLDLHDVLDAPWLLDGVDDYERAVFDAAEQRTIAPSALKLAIEERLFSALYDSDPRLLTSRRIEALGSLDPRLLARVEQEKWFQDGLNDFDVSLLGILADMVHVEDAVRVLDERNYEALRAGNTTLAVVLLGDSPRVKQQGFNLVEHWIDEVAAFAGEFHALGLIIDVTPVPGDPFCHGSGGSQYSVGFVAFTSSGCFTDKVVVHELAHAFIGGRFPAWFSEGIAELVTRHVLGEPAGYGGGTGLIDPEGYFFVGSLAYINQASLGADFLTGLYDLAPPTALARFVADVAGQRLSGQAILERIRAIEGVNRGDLERLISKYFGQARPPASSGVPAATPEPANR